MKKLKNTGSAQLWGPTHFQTLPGATAPTWPRPCASSPPAASSGAGCTSWAATGTTPTRPSTSSRPSSPGSAEWPDWFGFFRPKFEDLVVFFYKNMVSIWSIYITLFSTFGSFVSFCFIFCALVSFRSFLVKIWCFLIIFTPKNGNVVFEKCKIWQMVQQKKSSHPVQVDPGLQALRPPQPGLPGQVLARRGGASFSGDQTQQSWALAVFLG